MESYVYKSALELAGLIRNGQATSTEVVSQHFDQIHRFNEKINAMVMLFEESAMAEAAACDAEAKNGNFRGPLHGVPVTVKEQFWIKGQKSTINAKMHRNFVAPQDAVIVDRIKKSGAIILGKTNVPRFLTDFQVSGDLYPDGKNPYDPECTPGGSTGGGAAALAAGFTSLEFGGDLGGSVRNPAHFCGLYGLKPTEKTVPLHGNVPMPSSARSAIILMAQAGPLARTVEDVELLWKIIVGPDKSDRDIPRIEWKTSTKNKITGYTIAWVDGWPGFPVSSQSGRMIQTLVDKLSEAGCDVAKEAPPDGLHDDSLRAWMGIFPYIVAQEAPWLIRQFMKMQQRATLFKGENKYISEVVRGYKMNARHFGRMLGLRKSVVSRWEQYFEKFDFLICPMAFGPAYKRCKVGSVIHHDGTELQYGKYVWPYTGCFNASGHPAMSIPLGIGPEGLPVGVQIVGPYWSEPEMLHFAKLVSGISSGFVKPDGY